MTEHNTSGGLAEGEREALNVAVDEAETCLCCGVDYGSKHVYAAVERILADRLAAVQAETAAEMEALRRKLARAEAERDTFDIRAESAEAQVSELRAAVEAVLHESDSTRSRLSPDREALLVDRLRAALDSPTSHTQQEAEVQCPSGCGWNEPCPDPWHDRTATTRADALAADTTGEPS